MYHNFHTKTGKEILQICFVGNLNIGSFDNTYEILSDYIIWKDIFCKKEIMKKTLKMPFGKNKNKKKEKKIFFIVFEIIFY